MASIKSINNGDDRIIPSTATIEFNSSDLVILNNALYEYFKDRNMSKNEKKLKDILHISNQISQYGYMDNWEISKLINEDILKEIYEVNE